MNQLFAGLSYVQCLSFTLLFKILPLLPPTPAFLLLWKQIFFQGSCKLLELAFLLLTTNKLDMLKSFFQVFYSNYFWKSVSFFSLEVDCLYHNYSSIIIYSIHIINREIRYMICNWPQRGSLISWGWTTPHEAKFTCLNSPSPPSPWGPKEKLLKKIICNCHAICSKEK